MSLQDVLRTRRQGRPEAPRRRAPRLDLVVAWCVLLGPALALGGWALARQRVGDLEERLVRDAHALLAAPHPRPVHVDVPVPGTVGAAIAPHLPALDAEAQAVRRGDAAKELRAVVAGEAPFAALPARQTAALARLGPALDGVLAASRAERADFAEETDPFGGDGTGPAGFLGLQHAALLAGARVRLAVAAGDPEAALRDCLDALALGRDAAIWGGLVGHMVGVSIVSRLAPACAAALEALPPARLPEAARRVRTIRDAFPPYSATLGAEAVAIQLFAGEVLGAGVRARLPPRARRLLAQGQKDPPWVQTLLVRDGWRTARAALDRAAAAADLPERDREAAFQAITADLDRRLDFGPAIALPLSAYLKYARRAEDARRRLDALSLAAAARAFRAARGRWPAAAAELEEGGLPGAGELRFGAAGPSAPLILAVALRADPERPETFTVAVRPPRDVGAGSPPARRRAAAPR